MSLACGSSHRDVQQRSSCGTRTPAVLTPQGAMLESQRRRLGSWPRARKGSCAALAGLLGLALWRLGSNGAGATRAEHAQPLRQPGPQYPLPCANLSCPPLPAAKGRDAARVLEDRCRAGSQRGGRRVYDAGLCRPSDARAPEVFNTTFRTSAGDFVIETHRAWAPKSADRFWSLVSAGYYEGSAFYRVVLGWVVQWGPSGHPSLAQVYASNNCMAAAVQPCLVPGACFYVDPVVGTNVRGAVAFSTDLKSSVCECPCASPPEFCSDPARGDDALVAGSELYINLADNRRLDPLGFAPFGRVLEGGMAAVDAIYSGYGEMSCAPALCHDNGTSTRSNGVRCDGPDFQRIYTEGSGFLDAHYPSMSRVQGSTTG